MRSITSRTRPNSVRSLRRNRRRAGVLKKRSRTSTVVPGGCAAGLTPPAAANCAVEHEGRISRALPGGDPQARHRRDAGQRLATKPQRRDLLELLE
jgi:hypothetical protein